MAALTLLAVLASLLFAQVTLGLVVTFHALGKISRWRPAWLAAPAACGLAWVLAIGPAQALGGFTAAPRMADALLGRVVTDPAQALHLGAVSGATGHWLPGQFPVALILAAVAAAAWWWLDWLHTHEWDLPALRPGLICWCRGRLTAGFVRSGGVLTRDGASLGVDRASGRPAAVSWREAGQGMLVTGSAWAPAEAASFQFVHAAIRLRKPVIVVDLAGGPGLAASLAGVCAAAGAPMQVFGVAGSGCYEPLPGGDPQHRAALVMSLADWGQAPDAVSGNWQACLAGLFAVLDGAPGAPGAAMLDEVAALLHPDALRERLARVPAYHPGRDALAERAAATLNRLTADRATASFVAEQITSLRASPLGRWLRPARGQAPGARISLAETVRQRGVALFSLDRAAHGRAADVIADLVARDVAAVYTGYRQAAISGDGLCWFSRCESLDQAALARLAAVGADTGLASLLTTTSPAAAARLAAGAGVLVVHRLDNRVLAGRLGWLAGRRLVPAAGAPAGQPAVTSWAGPCGTRPRDGYGGTGDGYGSTGDGYGSTGDGPDGAAPPGMCWRPVVTGEALCALGEGEFTLITRSVAGQAGQAGQVGPVPQPGSARRAGRAGRAGRRGPAGQVAAGAGQASRVIPLARWVPARIRGGPAGVPGAPAADRPARQPGPPGARAAAGRPYPIRGWPR